MRFIYAGFLAAIFFALSISASSAAESPAPEGIGIRLLDIPAAAQTDPRARSYIVDHLAPGAAIERRVQVQNNTSGRQSIDVYAAAAEVSNGSFTGLDREARNELTEWTAVESPTVELAAGESAEVPVRIDVPADAPEGEHYAALWAEVRSTPDEGTQVVTASRVGIRVYLSVGPGNGPGAAFTVDSLVGGRTGDGAPQVSAEVTNTGGRTIDVQGILTLTEGPGGLSAAPASLDGTVTIAPGNSAPVTVTLGPELPSGQWQAKLDLASGLVKAQSTAELVIPELGAVQAEPETDSRLLITAVLAATVLLLAGAAFWVYRRRRHTGITADA